MFGAVDLTQVSALLREVQETHEEQKTTKRKVRRNAMRRAKQKKRREQQQTPMVTRSRLQQATAGEIELDKNLEAALFEQGLSKCATCEEVKEISYFRTDRGRNCIMCSELSEYKEKPLEVYSRTILRDVKFRARKKGIPVDIDADWIIERYDCIDSKCEICGDDMTHIRLDKRNIGNKNGVFKMIPTNLSLDQIEPSNGYTRTNIQLVHLQCNIMKMDIPQDAFIRLCKQIAMYHP